MPEGPEVQLIVDALNEKLRGKKLVNYFIQDRKWLKKGIQLEKILFGTLDSVERKAKYIVFAFNKDGKTFFGINHLAMTGQWIFRDKISVTPNHSRMTLQFENCLVDYVDTRKWGRWDLYDQEAFWSDTKIQSRIGTLGPEALGSKIELTYLTEKVEEFKKDKRREIEIKPLLMDQHFLSGIGNIYASEICFLAGVDPRKKFVDLDIRQLQSLIESTDIVMNKALEQGGSTIRDYRKPDGSIGKTQFNHMIYGKKFCSICSNQLSKFTQKSRTTYMCERCQK